MKLFKGLLIALALAFGIGAASAAVHLPEVPTDGDTTIASWCPPLC